MSTLAQVMACCLMAPGHYLNQCWFIISKVQWHSCEGIFHKIPQPSVTKISLKTIFLKFQEKSPRGQWVNCMAVFFLVRLLCCTPVCVAGDCCVSITWGWTAAHRWQTCSGTVNWTPSSTTWPNWVGASGFNRTCHPGGHCWDHSTGARSSSKVTATAWCYNKPFCEQILTWIHDTIWCLQAQWVTIFCIILFSTHFEISALYV